MLRVERINWGAADLREWRKKMGWTQQQAADTLGLTLRQYHSWEHGAKFKRYVALACLCLAEERAA